MKYSKILFFLVVGILLHSTVTRLAQASELAPPEDDGIAQTKKTVFLPRADLFYPLIADYKEPRFSASFIFNHRPGENFSAGLVSFGERFHILRYSPFKGGEGFQLSIDAGILSIFNFQSSSINLVNADYFGGLPLSWRSGPWSFRLRPYHQSSHLGDEFILTTPVNRINLSYEALDLLASREWKTFRVYGGAEFIMRREPSTFDRWMLHTGGEWNRDMALFWKAFPFVAIDLKSYEENNFFVNTAAKAGFNFRGDDIRSHLQRNLSLYLEAYYGFSPHGQFYGERIVQTGVGLSFDF